MRISYILLVFVVTVRSEKFCQSFVDNNYTIDYTYSRTYNNSGKRFIYNLIIDGMYWPFYYDDQVVGREMNISDDNGKINSVFDSTYRTATCIRLSNNGWKDGIAILLKKKNWKSYTTAVIPNDDYLGERGLEDYSPSKSGNLSVAFGGTPNFIISDDNSPGKSSVVLISKDPFKMERFSISGNEENLSLTKNSDKDFLKRWKPIEKFFSSKSNYSLNGLFPVWSRRHKIYGFIFFLVSKDVPKTELKYCYTDYESGNFYHEYCEENTTLLMNCSGFTPKPKTTTSMTSTTEEPDEEKPFPVVIVVIIIVLIVLIVIIAIVILVVCRRNQKSEETAVGSTASGVSKVLSKRSKDVGKSKMPSKTGSRAQPKASAAKPSTQTSTK